MHKWLQHCIWMPCFPPRLSRSQPAKMQKILIWQKLETSRCFHRLLFVLKTLQPRGVSVAFKVKHFLLPVNEVHTRELEQGSIISRAAAQEIMLLSWRKKQKHNFLTLHKCLQKFTLVLRMTDINSPPTWKKTEVSCENSSASLPHSFSLSVPPLLYPSCLSVDLSVRKWKPSDNTRTNTHAHTHAHTQNCDRSQRIKQRAGPASVLSQCCDKQTGRLRQIELSIVLNVLIALVPMRHLNVFTLCFPFSENKNFPSFKLLFFCRILKKEQ